MDILTIISNKSLRIPQDLSIFSIPSLRSPFKSNHFINVNIIILHMEINILRIVWKTIIMVSFHSLWMKMYIYLSTYWWDSSSYAFHSFFSDEFVQISLENPIDDLLCFLKFNIIIRVQKSYLIKNIVCHPKVCSHIIFWFGKSLLTWKCKSNIV